MGFCKCSMFCCALLYVISSYALILMGKERAGCFALLVFRVSRDCCLALPRGDMGLSAVCGCGIPDHTRLLFLCQTYDKHRERRGSVVECLTRDRRAAGSSLTGVTALWSLSKTHLS